MAGYKPYFRPNQKWLCGKACEGKECPVGPDAKGRCQATTECKPKKDEQGNFVCTRAPQFGGRCNEGPLPTGECSKCIEPCTPVRSVRATRALVVTGAVALAIGWVFLHFGLTKENNAFISPGELTSQHSSFEQTCSACHENADQGMVRFIASSSMQNVTSQKCLNCHTMNSHASDPHGVDPKVLLASNEGKELPAHLQALSCTQCHGEHHGKQGDIKTISNQRCNTCHDVKIDSFKKSHPEFTNWPFNRRTRLNFDHNSHFGKHFDDDKRKQISCQTCHVPDKQGQKMVLTGFQQSCASCHQNEVHGVDQINKGLVVFSLPIIDVESLKKKGIKIGEWPEYVDQPLNSFHRYFLAQDEKAKRALDTLVDVDLEDLSEASQEELNAVADIIWTTKFLIYDLANGEASVWSENVKKVLGDSYSLPMASKLSSGLPVEIWRAIARRWLPNLKKEVIAARDGTFAQTIMTKAGEPIEGDVDRMAHGGWYLDNLDYTVRYRPKGHADIFLKTWIDATVHEAEAENHKSGAFKHFTNADSAPGKCIECHSVDKTEQGLRVNWYGEGKEKAEIEFNRFSHVDHFSLLSKDGCFTCHQQKSGGDYQAGRAGFDHSKFDSNFAPITKDTCVQCHSKKMVKSDCLTCHNYHADRLGLSTLSSEKVHFLQDSSTEKVKDKSEDR